MVSSRLSCCRLVGSTALVHGQSRARSWKRLRCACLQTFAVHKFEPLLLCKCGLSAVGLSCDAYRMLRLRAVIAWSRHEPTVGVTFGTTSFSLSGKVLSQASAYITFGRPTQLIQAGMSILALPIACCGHSMQASGHSRGHRLVHYRPQTASRTLQATNTKLLREESIALQASCDEELR